MKMTILAFTCCLSMIYMPIWGLRSEGTTGVDLSNIEQQYENTGMWAFRGEKGSFSEVIAFGDSLTDTGNLFKVASGVLPISPPYYEGRFSNGPVWIEILLSRFLKLSPEQLSVYAYGGARTGPSNYPVPHLLQQIEFYQKDHPVADPAALYVLWAGSNDFIDQLDGLPVEEVSAKAEQAVMNITRGVETLRGMGAKRFLLLNAPNLVATPYVSEADSERGDRFYSETFGHVSVEFNQKLADALNRISADHSDVDLIQMDVYSLINQLIHSPVHYRLKNVKDRCNENDLMEDEKPVCEEPDTFLFWDNLHPTVRAHYHLASEVFQLLLSKGYSPRSNQRRDLFGTDLLAKEWDLKRTHTAKAPRISIPLDVLKRTRAF